MALGKDLTDDMLRSALDFQKIFAMVKINNNGSVPQYFQHKMCGIVQDDWFGDADDGKECTKFVCQYTSQGVHYYFCFGIKDYGPIKINLAIENIPFCALVANRGDEWFAKIFSNGDLNSVKDAVNSKSEEAVSFLGLTRIANKAQETYYRNFSFINHLEFLNNFDFDSIFKIFDDYFKQNKTSTLVTEADRKADLKAFAEEAAQAMLDGQIEKATEALKLDPDSASAYSFRGEAYRKKGRYDEAIKDLTESIRLDPDNDFAYSGRGAVYRQQGEIELAVQDFEKALSIDPDDELAKSGLEELQKKPLGPNSDPVTI
jgi:tetratricopeptide (TPR) repeat protein